MLIFIIMDLNGYKFSTKFAYVLMILVTFILLFSISLILRAIKIIIDDYRTRRQMIFHWNDLNHPSSMSNQIDDEQQQQEENDENQQMNRRISSSKCKRELLGSTEYHETLNIFPLIIFFSLHKWTRCCSTNNNNDHGDHYTIEFMRNKFSKNINDCHQCRLSIAWTFCHTKGSIIKYCSEKK
ncbi:hypothetical protein DERF_001370 [Dermatophagoides farinae]|uniref:Uncharacterized protein n=1 Tax=Dermatophagoides farinae TaxID=6954 RepID=A0A922L9B6_DERFA|nr:hypothetical protein DERF_001370 [Dermatophagoides farinae]